MRRVHLNDVGGGAISFELPTFRRKHGSSAGNTGSCRGLVCQLGLVVHAADVSFSLRAATSMGLSVTIIRAGTLSGTSVARRLPYLPALTRAYVKLVPSGKVHVVRSTDGAKSPPGNVRDNQLSFRVSRACGRPRRPGRAPWADAAWVMTAPPPAWDTRITVASILSSTHLRWAASMAKPGSGLAKAVTG
jgi:hypothetical protein